VLRSNLASIDIEAGEFNRKENAGDVPDRIPEAVFPIFTICLQERKASQPASILSRNEQ
jgi:hypothetical protein